VPATRESFVPDRTKVQDLCRADQYDRDMDGEPTGQLDLDLRKLRYFVAVAEELHFGRAAERLFLAQPVLSRQIQKLEQELGVTLFERTSRTVALTSAGRQLVDEARPLLAAGEAARRRVRQAAEARPTLTVGFFIGDATVTRAIRRFRERRPDVTTQVRRIYWSDQAQVLIDGAADVAFVHLPIDERGLELVPLYAEERVALLAADHPLARKKSIDIAQLADDPVVLHRGASDDWEAFHNQNPRPDGHVAPEGPTVANLEEKLEVVASGAAISFVPRSVAAAAQHQPGVAIVPVRDIPPTQVCLAWNSARVSPLVHSFCEAAREQT
jgi:DNA-binding transcriptional LysR family regulator